METSSPLICILEDDEAVRDSLRWLLERNGFSSQAFGSPNDFLLSSELDRYECLVVDVGLPGMSGLELLELLRARAYSKPVILIAATSDPQLEPRMRKAGASELLMKPIAPDVLLSALHRATDRSRGPALPT
jgi:FixJ family two-component response regulator